MDTLTADGDVTTAVTELATGITNELTSAIFSTICGDDEGCYRRAAQRVTTAAPTMLPGYSTTPSSERYPCTIEEENDKQCLHGGTCFASLGIENSRIIACSCPVERAGTRCHLSFVDPGIFSVSDRNIRTAQLAGSITVVVLISFAIILALYVWFRYKRKQHLLRDREFEASAEELYRRPFSNRSSIVESLSRPSSVRRGNASEKGEPLPRDSKILDVHNGNYRKSGVTENACEVDETIPLKAMPPTSDSRKDQTQRTPNSS